MCAGPDAYRDLPNLLRAVQSGAKNAINVQLSTEETYADVKPVRADGSHSAFVTIMRGCNNMCSFCIVPFTRYALSHQACRCLFSPADIDGYCFRMPIQIYLISNADAYIK